MLAALLATVLCTLSIATGAGGSAAAAPARTSAAKTAPATKPPLRTVPPKTVPPRTVPPKTVSPKTVPFKTTTPPAPQCTAGSSQSIPTVTQARSGYLTQLQPSTAWPIARGRGVLVALLDTGVAQTLGRPGGPLAGRLIQGANLAGDTDPHLGGLLDCDGQGTGDAALLAATDTERLVLPGVAPDARVLSIRVQADSTVGPRTAAVVAGMSAAIAARAGVIVVTEPCPPSPALAAVIRRAVHAGIVVVAAVRDPSSGTASSATYPAGYPGVVAVGAAPSSAGTTASSTGTQVDLVAPGSQLAVLTAAGHGYTTGSGNARAAALVAATAALVRSAYPQLTLAEVTSRLEYSAEHADGAIPDRTVGWGTVNPYAALALPLDRTRPPTGGAREPYRRGRAAAPGQPAPPVPGRGTGRRAGHRCLGRQRCSGRDPSRPAPGGGRSPSRTTGEPPDHPS